MRCVWYLSYNVTHKCVSRHNLHPQQQLVQIDDITLTNTTLFSNQSIHLCIYLLNGVSQHSSKVRSLVIESSISPPFEEQEQVNKIHWDPIFKRVAGTKTKWENKWANNNTRLTYHWWKQMGRLGIIIIFYGQHTLGNPLTGKKSLQLLKYCPCITWGDIGLITSASSGTNYSRDS